MLLLQEDTVCAEEVALPINGVHVMAAGGLLNGMY